VIATPAYFYQKEGELFNQSTIRFWLEIFLYVNMIRVRIIEGRVEQSKQLQLDATLRSMHILASRTYNHQNMGTTEVLKKCSFTG
jgi:hypothetical protein